MTRRRALLLVAGTALAWAVAVAITGGFVIETPWRRVSSRDAIRPLVVALALALFYAARWRAHLSADLGPLRRLTAAPAVALAAAALAVCIGLGWGSTIAAGPDASGYVSQAALLARGELAMRAPAWTADARWQDAAWSSAPVGYRPASETHILAPVYPPGLPLLMAGFQLVAGERAVFWVVPVLGGIAVWAAFAIGARLATPWTGALAALLLLSSPPFLDMLLQPMSDVPATAAWALALLASLAGSPAAAGAAVGFAILIRPNLAPLAVLPAALLALAPDARVRRVALFAVTASWGVLIIAALNAYHYGSPARSGYGSLGYLYAWDRIGPNLRQYVGWLVTTQSPAVFLGLAAPLVARRTARPTRVVVLVTFLFPAAILVLYLPYLTFQAYEWFYLRFLLPGYVGLHAGLALLVVAPTAGRSGALRRGALAVAAALVVVHGWVFAVDAGVFTRRGGDRRYARAVEYVRRLPERSVLVSLAHSGTLRLYTGRDVLRFEVLGTAASLDEAVAHVERHGYGVYFVGDPFELDMFQARFAGARTVAAMSNARRVDLGGVVVYELTEGTSPP